MLLTRNRMNASPFASPSYALAMKFTTPEYWIAGTKQTGLSSLSGYTFTRSGEQGAYDASGNVAYYAANTPAINTNGFWPYSGLTNLITNSQALAGGTGLFSCSVTNNAFNGPDGTATGDYVVNTSAGAQAAIEFQPVPAASTAYTLSIFVPKSGNTAAYAYLQININGGGATSLNINLSTGALSNNDLGAFSYKTVIDCGSFWRVVAQFTSVNALASAVYFGPADSSANRSSSLGVQVGGWQLQLIQGSYFDGGPIIRTAGATASIGRSVLTGTFNPITADQDFIAWGIAKLSTIDTIGLEYDVFLALGTATHFLGRNPSGSLIVTVGGAASYLSAAPQNIAGRYVVLWRRRGGKNTLAYKLPSGTVTLEAESGVTAFTAPTTTINLGAFNASTDQTDGALEAAYIKTGTYTDADITAILTAA